MLKNSKKMLAMLMALILCVSMPFVTVADETPQIETTAPPSDAAPTPEAATPTPETATPTSEAATPTPEVTTPLPGDGILVSTDAESEMPEASVTPEATPTDIQLRAVQPADVNLTLGQSVPLSLDGEYTQRCFIMLPQSGYLNLYVELGNSNPNSQATVRFVSGSLSTTYMSGTMSPSSPTVHRGDWFDAGSYCVLISLIPDNGNVYWPITYTIRTSFDSTSAVSGNGDMASARDLAVSASYTTGLLSRTNNASWWKITLPSAGRLEINLRSYVSAANAYVLQLRDGQRTRHYIDMSVVGGTDAMPQFSTSGDWLEAGTYYLCVNGLDVNTGLYGVMASFTPANNTEGNNNNSYLTASGLTVNGGAMRCLLSQTDEIDIVSFTLSARTTVTITTRAYMSALNLELFNANMRTKLGDASASGTGGTLTLPHQHQMTVTLDAGTYMIMASRDPEGPRGIFTVEVASVLTIASVSLNATVFNRGDAVTATCNITGKTATRYIYQLQVQDAATGTYSDVGLPVNSASNRYSVTPGGAGVYRFAVQAFDGYLWVTGTSAPFTVKAAPPLLVTSVVSNVTTLNNKQSITFTATTSGGAGLRQMTFCVFDSANTQVATITSGNNTGVYWPKTAGTYTVMAVATDGSDWASLWGDSSFTVTAAPALAVTSVTLNAETSAAIRTPLTITSAYANSTPTAWVYEVYYNGNFKERFNSTSSQFVYTPTAVGTYSFMAVATDGRDWASCWSKTIGVWDIVPLSIANIEVSATSVPINGSVNFRLRYSGGNKVQFTEYQLYNGANVMVDFWSGNSDNHSFAFATAGTYHMMAVAYDGTTWTAKYSVPITVAAPPAIVMASVTSNKTTANVGEIVTYQTTIASGTPTLYLYEIYNASNAVVYSGSSTSPTLRYSFSVPGTYRIMGVTTDGYNWASLWGSNTVTVTDRSQLAITSVTLDSTIKTYPQRTIVTPVFSGGKTIQQIYYEVYDAATNQLIASGAGKTGSFTYVPNNFAVTSCRIMVIATDGTDWASKWSSVITYTLPAPLQIASVTNNTVGDTIRLGQSVTFKANTTDGAALVSTEYHIYHKVGAVETMVDRINGNSKTVTFVPNTRGDYRVMFVAFDGITWVAEYSGFISVVD